MTTWYTVVGFGGAGGCPCGPWSDADAAADAIRRWIRRAEHRAGSQIARHGLRVLGYRTRQQARDGDISDGLGRNGCVTMLGLSEFVAGNGSEEDDGPHARGASQWTQVTF